LNIAVNTRLLIKGKLDGLGWFSNEILQRIVRNNPEVNFHFIFDRPFDQQFIFGPNVIPHIIGPPARHPLLYMVWFQFSIKRLLNKIKPDLFISPDGQIPLNTSIPTMNVIHDINFLYYPQDFDIFGRNYYNFFFPKYAKSANRIITVSEFSKQDICRNYHIPEEKISVIHNGIKPEFYPGSLSEKLAARQFFLNGAPYFIFVGTLIRRKNVCGLLNSFELFKERYHLPHKLLIVGNKQWWTAEMESTLTRLKHRTDIEFIGHLEPAKLRQAYIGANALVFIPHFEGFGVPVAEAMQCGIPVIGAQTSAIPEVGGQALLYVNPNEPDEVADALHILSEDSDFADDLVQCGLLQCKNFSWDNSAVEFWNISQEVINTVN